MASLREKVENHPAVFFLGVLLVGFLAGIGSYEAVLGMSGQVVVANTQVESLRSKIASLEATEMEQRWLRVRGVEGLEGLRARIVARVNGHAVSYPSRAVFSNLGQGMPAEDFALPQSEEYRISFEILGVGSNQKFSQFQSQEVVHVRQVPFEGEYKIFAITQDEWGTTRGITSSSDGTRRVEGRVVFEVR